MTDPKLIEAVAMAYAKIADGAVYDAMPPASREMYAKRVMPIITAYEAARVEAAVMEACLRAGLPVTAARAYASMAAVEQRAACDRHNRAMIAASQGER